MTVPTSKPPIMATAIGPNMASEIKGIIPKMVVPEAIMTGRRREEEAASNAWTGGTPAFIWIVISSISTTPFFIIIPISPKAPTIATKLKGLSIYRTRFRYRLMANRER